MIAEPTHIDSNIQSTIDDYPEDFNDDLLTSTYLTLLESFCNDSDSYCDSKYDSDELKQHRNKDEILPIKPERRNKYSDRKSSCVSAPKVDHTYTDYSYIRPDNILCSRPGRKNTFPSKLIKILSDPSTQDIVSWLPHGRSFKVKDVDKFERYVLPRYCKTNQMRSFRKQLSLWEFKRITRGVDAGSYYHECFLRGLPHLLVMMKYKKIKGIGKASAPNPDTEPNFYTLPDLSPYNERQSSLLSPTDFCTCQSFNIDQSIFAESDNDGDDDDYSFTYEEYIAVNRVMNFPKPFRPPSEIWL